MDSKIIERIVFLFCIVAVVIAIFIFSSQGGAQSKSVSKSVMRKIIDICPKTRDLKQNDKEEIIEKSQPFIRKLAHFSIYFLLGLMIMGFCSTYNLIWYKRLLITFLCALLYAMSDEIHQGFTGAGRTPRVFDVFIDTCGALTGAFLMMFVLHFVRRRFRFAVFRN